MAGDGSVTLCLRLRGTSLLRCLRRNAGSEGPPREAELPREAAELPFDDPVRNQPQVAEEQEVNPWRYSMRIHQTLVMVGAVGTLLAGCTRPPAGDPGSMSSVFGRSEERRVGKECSSRWS